MANRYWVGGSGTWDNTSTANWSATSGGAAGASAPVAADNVFFDANSGTAATVSVAATATCNDCSIDKADITLSLTGSPSFVNRTTLTTGTLTLNSYTLTSTSFWSSTSSIRTLNFGTGKVVVTGSAVAWNVRGANFIASGSRRVESTYSGSASRTLFHGYTVVYAAANSINLYVTAGTGEVQIGSDGNFAAEDVDLTGFSGSAKLGNLYVYGNLTLSATQTVVQFNSTSTFGYYFSATSTGKTITSNGATNSANVRFNGVGGSWVLQDTFTVNPTFFIILTNGTLDANNKNVVLDTFFLGSGTKTLTLGSGTWTVTGSTWDALNNSTNLTVSASTATISMTSASAKTFLGGSLTWPTLNQGGAGALTITGSNTFANITNTVQPATITLTAGTTQTVSAFGVSGTSGNLITLNSSSAGTRATISRASGLTNVSNVSVKDIAATGQAFFAYTFNGNTNGGNNIGIRFNLPDSSPLPSMFI